jgi:prepilin-type N-terminal cleavage/methylation domain-containing protein
MNRYDDQGLTLTEMLVALVLFGVVGIIVTTASITGLHRESQTEVRGSVLAQVRTALQRIDRDIRSTNPLLSATSTQLVLQETLPTTTRTVTYAVTGGALVVSEVDTTASGTTVVPAKVLLSNLVQTVTSPVFSVAPRTGYVAPTGSGVDASTCVMSGGGFDPGCVGSITVHVTTQPPALSPISVSDNGTELRNAS